MSRPDPAKVVAGAELMLSIFTKLNASLEAMGGSPEHLYRLSTPSGDGTIRAMAKVILEADGGLLSQHFSNLGFDMDNHTEVRAFNCLAREGIKTIADLVGRTEEELMRIPNFGVKSLATVNARLKRNDLHLRVGESDHNWSKLLWQRDHHWS